MTPLQTQELAQLRDIHLPDAIGWWPLAPGWYVLTIVSMVVLITVVFLLHRYYAKGRVRRQALCLLSTFRQQYQRDANSQLSASRISELLKRVALVYFPRARVASLQGESWLAFLNETSTGLDFKTVRMELLEIPYQSTTDYDLNRLFTMAGSWINQQRGAHV